MTEQTVWQQRWDKHRYTCLLFALLFLFLGLPFITQRTAGFRIADLVLMAVLLVSIWCVSKTRRHMIVGLVLAAPVIILIVIANINGRRGEMIASLVVTTLFLLYVGIIVFCDVIHASRVNMQTILGSICVYLTIGTLWAMIYAGIEISAPGSFNVGGVPTTEIIEEMRRKEGGESNSHFDEYIYYSYVTLTTLGYGDLTPRSRAAKAMASLEAIVGQIYLTVLVARLVGLHIAFQMERNAALRAGNKDSP
jgi:Ion channel